MQVTGQREQSPHLQPRWFIRSFWVAHRALYRTTRGRVGLRRPTPTSWGMLRLRTIGRRTGEERSAILGYYEDGPNLVTLAMNGWAEGEPAWWLNLQADPDAIVDLVDGPRKVSARAAVGDERGRLWARWNDVGDDVDAYATLRPSGTAVVVLEPRPADSGQKRVADGPAAKMGEKTMNTNRTIGVAAAKPGMSADRKAAVWIGVLYIIGTVALVLSVVVAGGVLTGPDYLAQVAAQPNQLAIGALLVLLAGFALAMVPVVFWPIGKRYNETLAIGYVVFRGAIETVLYIATAFGFLLVSTLSTEPGAAPLAGLVRTADTVAQDQLFAIPFVLGALMFYVLLYQSRLVPRWLSAWGLVGAALYMVPPLGSTFGFSLAVLMAPLALQEMVLAVWLIAKGFNPPAIAAEPAGDRSLQLAA